MPSINEDSPVPVEPEQEGSAASDPRDRAVALLKEVQDDTFLSAHDPNDAFAVADYGTLRTTVMALLSAAIYQLDDAAMDNLFDAAKTAVGVLNTSRTTMGDWTEAEWTLAEGGEFAPEQALRATIVAAAKQLHEDWKEADPESSEAWLGARGTSTGLAQYQSYLNFKRRAWRLVAQLGTEQVRLEHAFSANQRMLDSVADGLARETKQIPGLIEHAINDEATKRAKQELHVAVVRAADTLKKAQEVLSRSKLAKKVEEMKEFTGPYKEWSKHANKASGMFLFGAFAVLVLTIGAEVLCEWYFRAFASTDALVISARVLLATLGLLAFGLCVKQYGANKHVHMAMQHRAQVGDLYTNLTVHGAADEKAILRAALAVMVSEPSSPFIKTASVDTVSAHTLAKVLEGLSGKAAKDDQQDGE